MSEEDIADSAPLSAGDDQPNVEPQPAGDPPESEPSDSPAPTGGPVKTQGVRATRADAGRRVLQRAAKVASRTGRRGDVHEYMRIRRSYV